MGDHVFVSYARADAAYVSELLAHLRTSGVDVWNDAEIDFGAKWLQEIEARRRTHNLDGEVARRRRRRPTGVVAHGPILETHTGKL